jgi:hypothetical protein
MTNFVLVESEDATDDNLTEAEFFALYPLFRLACQRATNRDPSFDYSLSRDDLMNGKNGIPAHVGVKIVFTLLLVAGKYVDMSPDQQSFRINDRGMRAVHKFSKK